jgi:hypothetical protein
MGRKRTEIMAGLPAVRRGKIEARAAELRGEVDRLKALRLLTERTRNESRQTGIAE